MPRDVNQLTHKALQIAIGEDVEPEQPDDGKDPATREPWKSIFKELLNDS
jgi:hypothetical protein